MQPADLKRPASLKAPHPNEEDLKWFDSDDCDIGEDISSEMKVNHVYDSSKVIHIRNSLIISKGSPKRAFCNSLSPKYGTNREKADSIETPFKLNLHKSKTIYEKKETKKPSSCKGFQGDWESNRKPSIEILLKLQKKLADMKKLDFKQTEDKMTPPKIISE
ncbi:unnamed protein product [Moneuplotes crassus]|uniref:Uncharacterized protein n=1 Tax=Euplotes crassus TaxID=5936 RepID=A0AAD1Y6K3_EUPCR|nr:unnamed protein product [Moneuplotes crassus]